MSLEIIPEKPVALRENPGMKGDLRKILKNDTIVAPATPWGVGAVGIIRLSGREAISIASRLFRARSGKRVEEFPSFRFFLGDILDPVHNIILDEALCVVMRAPRSYTREDVVEFHLHGGPLILRKVLDLCLQEGARMAKPGEFTERAFLNGRIDLFQAEAVAEIIKTQSEKALALLVRNLKGEWGKKIRSWQEQILLLQAHIQASCDFPDAFLSNVETFVRKGILTLRETIAQEFEKSYRAQPLQEGFLVVIAGKPNVGKSSLLNTILGKERAIVAPLPGTTRDAIEEIVILGGFPVRFVDTAGFRDSTDLVERLGVEKTREYLQEADLIVVLFDRSRPLESEDQEIACIAREKPHLVVFNKSDLPAVLSKEEIHRFYPQEEILEVSSLTGEGKELLLERIIQKFQAQVGPEDNLTFMSTYQREKLQIVLRLLVELDVEIEQGIPLDIIGLRLGEILQEMQKVTGENVDAQLLETIFSHFCVGK